MVNDELKYIFVNQYFRLHKVIQPNKLVKTLQVLVDFVLFIGK